MCPCVEAVDSLKGLFVHQLAVLLDAEHRIAAVLREMREAATREDLKAVLSQRAAENAIRTQALEWLLGSMAGPMPRESCDAVNRMIREASVSGGLMNGVEAQDAAFAACAERLERYALGAYSSAYNTAKRLPDQTAAAHLRAMLEKHNEWGSSWAVGTHQAAIRAAV